MPVSICQNLNNRNYLRNNITIVCGEKKLPPEDSLKDLNDVWICQNYWMTE